MLIMEHGGRV